MSTISQIADQDCQKFTAKYFTTYPNLHLQVETDRIMKKIIALKIPMPGKPGGWAGGILYAAANQGRRACGIPGLLNQESAEFFGVSMDTIYRRAWQIRRLLLVL